MDSCPSAAQLDRLLAERLDADERTSVSGHVQKCAVCQQALEGLTRQDASTPGRQLDMTTVITSGSDAAFLRRMESLSPPMAMKSVWSVWRSRAAP